MRRLTVPLIAICQLAACRNETAGRPRFELLSPGRTGVTFANTITPTDSLNAVTDAYIYNGAGVGVGDIDNDGLPDLFFAGNMVSSRLYLNRGKMRFEDITQSAGVTTHCWATGVSLVDINHDGWLDIYVSCSGPEWSTRAQRANLLFINNGNRTFSESARKYGIADSGFTTHAAFLDYDKDGDLDLFLLNNSPYDFQRAQLAFLPPGARGESPESYNELYRNNGDGTFTNVSDAAGILRDVGYGLGVAVADVNGDGWPDIYVSNDITPNDVLYINQRNGTFRDMAGKWLKHTSYAGMGVDIADFNGDGRPDIVQADMMPPALEGRKRVSLNLTYGNFVDLLQRGFRPDYEVNTLQLNNGVTPDGGGGVLFSEIAHVAGIAYTDWSWSPLFADFDDDGLKDLFISNGYPKGVNDTDYKIAVFAAQRAKNRSRQMELLQALPAYRVPSYVFRNNGDLTFTDESKAWGINQPGFGYGAAYADLNNDGRLDVVVNNIDAPASIYENVGGSSQHSLTIVLRGDAPNVRGLGASVTISAAGRRQYLYQSPYRGYTSTVDDRLHFGLGSDSVVDSLEVTWPDGRSQLLTRLKADAQLVLQQSEASQRPDLLIPAPTSRFFQPLRPGLPYSHPQPEEIDFAIQPLLPDQVSHQGPPLAVADVDGDGREDVFAGNTLLLQRSNGAFIKSWTSDSSFENWGAVFFDANGDGRPDLYLATGGYRLSPASAFLQDRLYINRGAGRLVRDSTALPVMLTSTAAVAAGDFTGDGKPDLFVGGRMVPRSYPYPARSYLLRNDGRRFTDVTDAVCPALAEPFGMVTAAVWIDFDGDGRLDLVTAGEWMPLHFFRNDGTTLRDVTASIGLGGTRGRWFALATGDFNHDGRPDLIAGNLGLNHTYTTSPTNPFGIWAGGFAGGQRTDVIVTTQEHGRDFPIGSVLALGSEIYTIATQYPSLTAFSTASMDQIFRREQLAAALHYEMDTFASLYLQNNGDGTFTATPLPTLAQIAPIRGIAVTDVDGDGNLDAIVAGNLYDSEPNTPRADAGNGLWLKGNGHGHFTPIPPAESGFLAPLNVRGLVLVKTPTGSAVFVANNGDSLSAYTIRPRERAAITTAGSA